MWECHRPVGSWKDQGRPTNGPGYEHVSSCDHFSRLLPPEGVDLPLLCDEMNRLGVSCSKPDGYLRIAPHWPNALDEADQVNLTLKNAVDAVLGERPTTVPVG